MNSSEKLCLQWNDFKENLTISFKELREDKDFADATLACEDGQQIEVHKTDKYGGLATDMNADLPTYQGFRSVMDYSVLGPHTKGPGFESRPVQVWILCHSLE